jgi:hypothetical protein
MRIGRLAHQRTEQSTSIYVSLVSERNRCIFKSIGEGFGTLCSYEWSELRWIKRGSSN